MKSFNPHVIYLTNSLIALSSIEIFGCLPWLILTRSADVNIVKWTQRSPFALSNLNIIDDCDIVKIIEWGSQSVCADVRRNASLFCKAQARWYHLRLCGLLTYDLKFRHVCTTVHVQLWKSLIEVWTVRTLVCWEIEHCKNICKEPVWEIALYCTTWK